MYKSVQTYKSVKRRLYLAKKRCYPLNVSVTETKAEVLLQTTLNHTSARITLAKHRINQNFKQEVVQNITFISKWGFDGSSGMREYKQSFLGRISSDSNDFRRL